jgi:hypothetical protein
VPGPRSQSSVHQLGLHHSGRTATVDRPGIASTMSSEEYMNEPVVPDGAVGSAGDGAPAPAAAPQDAGAKSGAEAACGTGRGSSTLGDGITRDM